MKAIIDRVIVDGGPIDFIIFIVGVIIVYFYLKNTDNKKWTDKFNHTDDHASLPQTSPKQGKSTIIIIVVVLVALIGGGLIFG